MLEKLEGVNWIHLEDGGRRHYARTDDGDDVFVDVSAKAEEEYKIDVVWATAQEKYERGAMDSTGEKPIITVTPEDCAEWNQLVANKVVSPKSIAGAAF